MKKFETFERRYATDLSAWLSNLYIDIRHLPREFNNEVTGERFNDFDFDFEVDYVNGKVWAGGENEGARGVEGDAVPDALVNKGKKTNSKWNEKAANIFLKKQNECEGKRRKRRGKKKVGVEPETKDKDKDADEGYHSEISDGEDGG